MCVRDWQKTNQARDGSLEPLGLWYRPYSRVQIGRDEPEMPDQHAINARHGHVRRVSTVTAPGRSHARTHSWAGDAEGVPCAAFSMRGQDVVQPTAHMCRDARMHRDARTHAQTHTQRVNEIGGAREREREKERKTESKHDQEAGVMGACDTQGCLRRGREGGKDGGREGGREGDVHSADAELHGDEDCVDELPPLQKHQSTRQPSLTSTAPRKPSAT